MKPVSNSTRRSSFLVSLGILLSRVFGLVREKIFAHYLGNSPPAAAFRAALRIPNFLQNLLGEGVLSASFIPVYSRLRAAGDNENARLLAGVVGGLLSLAVSILVLGGILFTSSLVEIVAPGFTGALRELTIEIVRILFPMVGLLVLSAWCLGVLNSHRKFFLSYVSPVFWNLALIATLLIFGPGSSDVGGATNGFGRERLVIALAWGSLVGSALQFGVQLPFVFQHAGRIRLSLDRRLPAVRDVLKNFVPILISRGVVQLSAFIDGMIASFLGAAAVASLAYAQTIYFLPISLFGMAVAAAELPEMSADADGSDEAKARLRARILAGMQRIAFFVVPSGVAFLFLGRFIVQLLLQSGSFGFEDTLYAWYILMGYSVGLVATTWSRLFSSTFYALGDARTPLRFAVMRVTIVIGLGLVFAFPLRTTLSEFIYSLPGLRRPALENIDLAMGAVGLTLGAALAGWIEYRLLHRALEKKIGQVRVPLLTMAKLFSAALIAAGAAWALVIAFLPTRFSTTPLGALLALTTDALVYALFCLIFKIDELQPILKRLGLFG